MAEHPDTILPKDTQDRSGTRSGSLSVISFAGIRNGEITWVCRCDCGDFPIVFEKDIASGDKKKCKRTCKASQTGITNLYLSEYRAYIGTLTRCYNENCNRYSSYGARGIQVVDRWRFGEDGQTGFECFLSDIGTKPSPKHTLDRIDTNRNYGPENCRWATQAEQQRNRRDRRLITARGKTMNLVDWGVETGINPDLIRRRIRVGWTEEQAVTIVPTKTNRWFRHKRKLAK